MSYRLNAVLRPAERIFAQDIAVNQSLIFLYVRKNSKTLVIFFPLKAV